MADVGKAAADTHIEKTALRDMQDQRSFTRFRHAQLAPFFNDRAASETNPVAAQMDHTFAELFTESLRLFDKVTADQPYSDDEKKTMTTAIMTAYTMRQNTNLSEDIDRYAAARLDTFIAEDPERWKRLESNAPATVSELTQYRPSTHSLNNKI